jgi:hypothetical protein
MKGGERLFRTFSLLVGFGLAIPTVTYMPLYVVIVGLSLLGVFWRWPSAGLVLLPVTTLLFPEVPLAAGFGISANVAIITAFVLVTNIRTQRFELPKKYLLALFVTTIVSLIATTRGLISVVGTDGMQFLYLFQWISYLSFPLFCVILAQYASDRGWEKIYRATLLTVVGGSLIIVVHLVTVHLGVLPPIAGGEEIERAVGQERLRTVWSQGPNTTGMFLTIQALFGFGAFLEFRDRRVRATAVAYTVLTTILMFYTFSRSAMAALVVGLGALSLVSNWRYFIGLGAMCVSVIPVAPVAIRQRFFAVDPFERHYIEPLERSLPVGPLAERVSIWATFIDDFQQYPLFGSGFFRVVMDNTYLNLLVGTGLVGLTAHFLVLAYLARFCYSAYRHFHGVDPVRSTVGLVAFGSLAALLTWGLFSEMFARWRVLGLLSVLVGLNVGSLYRNL